MPSDSQFKPARTMSIDEIRSISSGRHHDPCSILGLHQMDLAGNKVQVIRALVPDCQQVSIKAAGNTFPMDLVGDSFYEAVIRAGTELKPYSITGVDGNNQPFEYFDPYQFGSVLTEYDLHLLGEGSHYRIFERLGGRLREHEGQRGASFAVWAPNAWRVSVVGDFNQWDGRRHVMRKHPGSGCWDLFVPNLPEGTLYKFEILDQFGHIRPLKADPYGLAFELRPGNAAKLTDLSKYDWKDSTWMHNRKVNNSQQAPISIYEVHLGSWMRSPEHPEEFLSYRDLAPRLVKHAKDLGFTHLELLPVNEHPFDGSWGYQSLGYYAPTSRFGTPADFMWFVDYCHEHEIGVLIDWVPAHFPKDDHGLRLFDGTALYEHMDPRQGEHPEWGTNVFNFARNEVSNFLIGSALFWLEYYHIDGIRVDAVASMLYLDYSRKEGEWIPNQFGGNENLAAIAFVRRLNELIFAKYPDILSVAEESTSWSMVSKPTYVGGLGFSYKWNMGWMNDTLRYLHREPVHRRFHQNDLTFSLMYAFSENFVLPLSHDEVVHGKGSLLDKMPGDTWQKFANLRLLFGYMWGHPGKKLLFMGGEFGQWQEWRHFQSLDWHLLNDPMHRGVMHWVRDLNQLLKKEPALHINDFEWTGFQWVEAHNADASVLAFLRIGSTDDQDVLFACNFTPVPREGYRLGVPEPGFYLELLNSDSEIYGGSNLGNRGESLPIRCLAWISRTRSKWSCHLLPSWCSSTRATRLHRSASRAFFDRT